jgi:hypothetical protein
MMKLCDLKNVVILSLFISAMFLVGVLFAQEETYLLEHKDVFVQMERPAVLFSHTLHEDSLAAHGCGVCHHVFDEQKKQLVYMEDEEQECKSCHEFKRDGKILALREAFHKSCTGCHRKMKKSDIEKSGPTTCGECHKK